MRRESVTVVVDQMTRPCRISTARPPTQNPPNKYRRSYIHIYCYSTFVKGSLKSCYDRIARAHPINLIRAAIQQGQIENKTNDIANKSPIFSRKSRLGITRKNKLQLRNCLL